MIVNLLVYIVEHINLTGTWRFTMKLYFIRHGQTDWNLQKRIQGSYDSELNIAGIAQAEELSKKISEFNYKFSKIYTSKQKRAVKTAQIISETINVAYTPIDGLEEVKLGDWEGLTWDEVKERFPYEYEEWYKKRRYTKPPKGESYQDMLVRVLDVLHRIIHEECENVAIVTHSAVIMCLQCYLTDTPFNDMIKFSIDNSSILELDSELFTNKLAFNGI